jgi:hypothetical protein
MKSIHDLSQTRDEYKTNILEYMNTVVVKHPHKSIVLYSLYNSKKQYGWCRQLIKAGKLVDINGHISLPEWHS